MRKQQTEKSSSLADELMQIRGIGQATIQALNQIGIFRMSDLAARNSDELAEALRPVVPGITPQRINREDWIGQAKALSSKDGREPDDPAPLTGETVSVPDGDWYELSDFFVSFGYAISQSAEKTLQTRIEHSQSGSSEKWNGIAGSELLNWMLERAGAPQAEVADSTATASVSQPGDTAVLTLSELRIMETETPFICNRHLYSSGIHAECRLEVSEAMSEIMRQEQPLDVEFHLVNVRSHDAMQVNAVTSVIEPDSLTYHIEQDLPTNKPGLFQLMISAQLRNAPGAAARIVGPVFQVGT